MDRLNYQPDIDKLSDLPKLQAVQQTIFNQTQDSAYMLQIDVACREALCIVTISELIGGIPTLKELCSILEKQLKNHLNTLTRIYPQYPVLEHMKCCVEAFIEDVEARDANSPLAEVLRG